MSWAIEEVSAIIACQLDTWVVLQYATETEVKGLWWHEVPINMPSTERPSSQTWQGQQGEAPSTTRWYNSSGGL